MMMNIYVGIEEKLRIQKLIPMNGKELATVMFTATPSVVFLHVDSWNPFKVGVVINFIIPLNE